MTVQMDEQDAAALRMLQQALADALSVGSHYASVEDGAIERVLRILRPEWYGQQAAEANGTALTYHDLPPILTVEAHYIADDLLPEWLALFLKKNAKYRDVQHLGAKGTFPDVNRKVGAIKSVVWNGEPEADGAESTRQVIMDLIGHLFLMLALYDVEQGSNRNSAFPPVGADASTLRAYLNNRYGADVMGRVGTFLGHKHESGESNGKATDGWDDLPVEVQRALARIANNDDAAPRDVHEVQSYVRRKPRLVRGHGA
jgi:hypothetical protein